jgi:hypothetical protein
LCRKNVTVDVSAALCIGFGSTQILDNIESLYNIRDPSEVVRQQPVAIPPPDLQPPAQLQPLPNLQPPAQLGAELQLLEHYRRRQEAVRRNQENLIRFRNERRQETDEERLQRQQAVEIRRQQIDEERRQADIRTRAIREYRRAIELNNTTNLSNITNLRFKWIKSLKWKESVVNHFKAWIMYNDNVRYLENKHNEKSLGGQRLNDLKVEHNYEALKYSTEAPWYCFLFQADILD